MTKSIHISPIDLPIFVSQPGQKLADLYFIDNELFDEVLQLNFLTNKLSHFVPLGFLNNLFSMY